MLMSLEAKGRCQILWKLSDRWLLVTMIQHWILGTQTSPLQEQGVLLTTESSLDSLMLFLLLHVKIIIIMDEYPLSEMLEMRNVQISHAFQILDFLYLFLSSKCFTDECLHVNM